MTVKSDTEKIANHEEQIRLLRNQLLTIHDTIEQKIRNVTMSIDQRLESIEDRLEEIDQIVNDQDDQDDQDDHDEEASDDQNVIQSAEQASKQSSLAINQWTNADQQIAQQINEQIAQASDRGCFKTRYEYMYHIQAIKLERELKRLGYFVTIRTDHRAYQNQPGTYLIIEWGYV